MTLWKKLAIGVGSLLLVAVCAIGVFIYTLPPLSDMCGDQVLAEYPSPNRELKAVVFERDCGATTDFNTHVAIVPSNIDTSQKDSLPQSFFAADGNHGRAPAGKGGGPEVRLRWQAEDRLELQHHDLARVIRAKEKSEGIAIDYKMFR